MLAVESPDKHSYRVLSDWTQGIRMSAGMALASEERPGKAA